MKITKTKSYKAAFTGIAAAVAITLSFLEGLIPTAAFMPPGAKAGFSNIAVMFAASEFGLIPALSVTLLKSLFVFLTRGATAFFMSLAGGVLSTLVMYLLFLFYRTADANTFPSTRQYRINLYQTKSRGCISATPAGSFLINDFTNGRYGQEVFFR